MGLKSSLLKLRKYWVAGKISARDSSSNHATIFSNCCGIAVTLITLFSVYHFAFAARPSIQGVTLSMALWSIGMYTVYWSTGVRNIYRDIALDVKNGSVEGILNKPVDYIVLSVCKRLGRQTWVCISTLTISATILFLMAGAPPVGFSFIWLIEFLSLGFFGFLLSLISFSLIGITSFWLDDPEPVMWIFDKSVMILGGSIVPVVFFPDWLKLLATWLPMGAMISFARAFTNDFATQFPTLLLSQLIWCVVMLSLAIFSWQRAKKILSIYGG
jgi:ABC-2 type transport system permease protein